MKYEYNREDLNALVDYINAETKVKGKELVFKYCPVCHSSATDKWTSSINIETGLFNCKRGSCPTPDMNFFQLARECGYSIPGLAATSFYHYQQIPEKDRDTRQEAVDYLKGRGIPEEVTRRYFITMDSQQSDKVMLFPFYDENNVCQMYKCRNINPLPNQNKEWLFKASDMKENEVQKMILFGMYQRTDESRTLIMTEGQIDSLSVITSGYPNAVSVPNGKNGFTWWSNCMNWIYQNFDKVIVFGDYENGSISLLEFMEKNCDIPVWHVRPIDYLDCKDANEILTRYGVDDVRRCIDNAVEMDVKGCISVADVKLVSLDELERYPSGITSLDKNIGGLIMGKSMVLTGKRGEGKSTVASQIICNVLKDTDANVLVYSGELPNHMFKSWLYRQASHAGQIETINHELYGTDYAVDPERIKKLDQRWADRLYIIDDYYEGSIFEQVERVVKTKSIKIVLIDNLMSLVARDSKDMKDQYFAQSVIANTLASMARRLNIFIILVAHPKKGKVEGDKVDLISGSGDIGNAVDLVVWYSKGSNNTGRLELIKNRNNGRVLIDMDAIETNYEEDTKKIVESNPHTKYYKVHNRGGSDAERCSV